MTKKTSLMRNNQNTRPIEVVLFDLDGTLVDTAALILASFRYATQKVLGYSPPDEQLTDMVGIPLDYQMRVISPKHADELVRVYREHNSIVHDELIKYFPGTREALDTLQAEGMRMAVVTSKRREVAARGLSRFNLSDYFELVIGSNDTDKHKPDPEPLLLAAERMSVSADQTIYLGDSPYDMEAARAAGSIAVAALWGMFSRERLRAADAQMELTQIEELPNLVRNLNRIC